ncbi:hypothetical protein ACQ1ZW_16045, partial [Enterococcus faecalis]|uniref:hypothetical protein n=1 Tax=Enterococcus faecalis TaxID=1351 RepID=UPI003D6A9C34
TLNYIRLFLYEKIQRQRNINIKFHIFKQIVMQKHHPQLLMLLANFFFRKGMNISAIYTILPITRLFHLIQQT